MLGRWLKIKNNWQWVEITPEEEKQLQEQLREENMKIMQECTTDAGLVLLRVRSPQDDRNYDWEYERKLAVALFDKRATQFYSFELAYLDKKCKELRKASSCMEKKVLDSMAKLVVDDRIKAEEVKIP